MLFIRFCFFYRRCLFTYFVGIVSRFTLFSHYSKCPPNVRVEIHKQIEIHKTSEVPDHRLRKSAIRCERKGKFIIFLKKRDVVEWADNAVPVWFCSLPSRYWAHRLQTEHHWVPKIGLSFPVPLCSKAIDKREKWREFFPLKTAPKHATLVLIV